MAGGSFGSVLGVFLGGILAVQLGWRWSFGVMAILGLVLVALYGSSSTTASSPATSTPATSQPSPSRPRRSARTALWSPPRPSSARTSAAACSCSSPARSSPGCPATSAAYGLAPNKAGIGAAGFILLMGAGMIICGMVTDRLTAPADPEVDDRAGLRLAVARAAAPGLRPRTRHAAARPHRGRRLRGGHRWSGGAMVANLTPASIRSTAFGTLTLANNLLGLPRPWWSGSSPPIGLVDAMKIVPYLGPRHRGAVHRASRLPQQHPPSRRHRVGLTHHRRPGMMPREPHTTTVIVPGLRGPRRDHWQTRLAAKLPAVVVPSFTRDKRDLAGRVADLHQVISDANAPVTIVAHSAGVLTTVHWALRRPAGPWRAARHTSRPRQTPRAAVPVACRAARTAAGSPSPWHRSGFPASWRPARTTCSATSSASGHGPRMGQPLHRHRTRRPPQPLSRVRRLRPRPSSGSSWKAMPAPHHGHVAPSPAAATSGQPPHAYNPSLHSRPSTSVPETGFPEARPAACPQWKRGLSTSVKRR